MRSSNTIGERIKMLREAKGLTQAELANELSKELGFNVKRETINQWENGARDLKTDYTVILAKYFNQTCDYILRGVKSENIDIHEKLGLSDKAIEELIKLNTNKEFLSVLNTLLEREDFTNRILGSIHWLKIDALNKIIFEEEFKKNNPDWQEWEKSNELSKEAVYYYGERLMGEWISVNPSSFYFYSKNELKDNFMLMIDGILLDYLKSIDLIAEKERIRKLREEICETNDEEI